MNEVNFKNNDMKIIFEKRRGIVKSIKFTQDSLQTEFIGNANNISYPEILEMNQWFGDLKVRTWDENSNNWTLELTEKSSDNRRVSYNENGIFTVEYSGNSKRVNGINNVSLQEKFSISPGEIHLDITVKNITDHLLEIGEISIPFISNSDFTGIFLDASNQKNERWRGSKQKIWHEERVQIFTSINGSSSYIFLQRPKGDFPGLLFQTTDGTSIEAAYQMSSEIGCQWDVTFEGPYYFSLYSNAAKKTGRWKWTTDRQAYGINGNSSLLLESGEEKTFHFRICTVNDLDQIKDRLYEAGQLAVNIQPGMVIPTGYTLSMQIQSKDEIDIIPACNNVEIKCVKKEKDMSQWEMVFSEAGQKKIQIKHGYGITNLFFYSIGDVKELICRHADFICRRQYYENLKDPYNRNHTFLPYDDMVEMIYTTSEESWQVAGLDEYCLPIPMFLAKKNTVYPVQREIDILEEYIEDSLYCNMQQRDTFYARRSMYYEERKPSDKVGFYKFTKEESEDVERSFNYNLISNIYFCMYEIAKKYKMTKYKTAYEYLDMAYHTAMVGFQIGENKYNGAPAGATVVQLLEALKKEEHEGYPVLLERLKLIAEVNAKSEYPFGSELFVDQTPHNQYQAIMKYFGYTEQVNEAYRVTLALRSGFQPAWFLYGNEKRGNVCCWYATPLNSRVLYEGYDESKNINMIRLAYGGLFSFLTCLRSNGAAHGWYLFWPDRTGFDLRSLDTDMGMYGYLISTKAYVVKDDIFGICGYGCEVKTHDEKKIIMLYDGVGKELEMPCFELSIKVEYGSIKKVEIEKSNCTIYVENNTEMYQAEISVKQNGNWNIKKMYL